MLIRLHFNMNGILITALLALLAFEKSQGSSVIAFPDEADTVENVYIKRQDFHHEEVARMVRNFGDYQPAADLEDSEMAEGNYKERRDSRYESVDKMARSASDADSIEAEMADKGYIDRRDSEHSEVAPEEVNKRSLDRRFIWYRYRRCFIFIIPIASSNDTGNVTTTPEDVVTTEMSGNVTEAEASAGNETVIRVLLLQRCYYYYYPFFARPRPPFFGLGPVILPPGTFNVTDNDNSTTDEATAAVISEGPTPLNNETTANVTTAAPAGRKRRDFGRYGPDLATWRPPQP